MSIIAKELSGLNYGNRFDVLHGKLYAFYTPVSQPVNYMPVIKKI